MILKFHKSFPEIIPDENDKNMFLTDSRFRTNIRKNLCFVCYLFIYAELLWETLPSMICDVISGPLNR
jgi:hypothetical protein